MDNGVVVWRIVDWDGRYESPQSLKKPGALASVPVSADLGRLVLARLLERADSAEVLGVWYYLQMLAAQGDRRGTLCFQGAALRSGELAKLSGFDVRLVERVLAVLGSPEIRLLEQVPLEVALQPPVIEPPKPRKPRQSRPRAFFQCPKCAADLVALAESGEFEHLLIPESDTTHEGHDCGCGKDHGVHCAASVRTVGATSCAASAEPASPTSTGIDNGQSTIDSEEESCGPWPETTPRANSSRPRRSKVETTACRKNRKVARQAKKKARQLEARRR